MYRMLRYKDVAYSRTVLEVTKCCNSNSWRKSNNAADGWNLRYRTKTTIHYAMCTRNVWHSIILHDSVM